MMYKGYLLGKGSFAMELYEKKEYKLLDKHLRDLDKKNEELVARYEKRKENDTHRKD